MSRIYLKYFPDLPEGETFKNTTRKGNIFISNNIGNATYGPTSETGFYAGPPVTKNGGYVLYTYALTNDQINSKPTIDTSEPTIPSKEGGSWSSGIIPEARFFDDGTGLTKYYNSEYSTTLDLNGVLSAINSDDNLYLESIVMVSPTPTPTPSSGNTSPPIVGGPG